MEACVGGVSASPRDVGWVGGPWEASPQWSTSFLEAAVLPLKVSSFLHSSLFFKQAPQYTWFLSWLRLVVGRRLQWIEVNSSSHPTLLNIYIFSNQLLVTVVGKESYRHWICPNIRLKKKWETRCHRVWWASVVCWHLHCCLWQSLIMLVLFSILLSYVIFFSYHISKNSCVGCYASGEKWIVSDI